jgi:hypothetical protein
MSCQGELSIATPDGHQLSFGKDNNTDQIHAEHPRNLGKPMEKREVESLIPFFWPAKAPASRVKTILDPFAFLTGPIIISDYYQKGFSPRCEAQIPFGLVPYVKPGACPAYYNGCGAENGIKVPDLRFGDCCNNHDLCYGKWTCADL